MSDQAPEGTQAAATTEAASPSVDLGPVLERIDELGTQVQSFQQQQGGGDQFAGQGGYDLGYDPYGAQPQEPGYQYGQPDPYAGQVDQFGNPVQQGGLDPNMGDQQALGMLNQLIGQAVSQATSPLMQRLDAQEMAKHTGALETQRAALAEKYPDLAGEGGQQIQQKASEQANQMAAALAPLIDPSASPQESKAIADDLGRLIAGHPMFTELAYLASTATQEGAEQGNPATAGQDFQLEAAGGAAQQQQQASPGSQYLGLAGEQRERSLSELW